jgi:hypothetical protein
MRQGFRQSAPALAISILALFVALGGTVYAAAKINGRSIKVKSLPGNRLKPRSIAANRLKPNVLRRAAFSGPLTGVDINELTLGQVPSATHAESADVAQSAVDAQTALNAVNAIDASTVNGHNVGCLIGTQQFAGACWQSSNNEVAATAPEAAADCASKGGALPEALQLAAFAELPGVNLDGGDEWSGDLTNVSGPNAYAVITVSNLGVLNVGLSTVERQYRCVIPLLT